MLGGAAWGAVAVGDPPGPLSWESGLRGVRIAAALPTTASMNVALYAGIAGGAVVALILIGVLIYCCCCRAKGEDKSRP